MIVRMRGLVLVACVGLAASALAAAPRSQVDRYNGLVTGGNRAAQRGDFISAKALWKRAIPLDPSPDLKCRGEFLRVSIVAATHAQAMVAQGKLSADKAPAYYQQHSTDLWLPNKCNSN
jgi:hypothetical protein